jgi:pyruvate,orthophosphate dikinase
MYSNVVLGLEHHTFEEILDEWKDRLDASVDTDLPAEDWERWSPTTRKRSPRDGRPTSRRTRRTSCGARSAPCSPAG